MTSQMVNCQLNVDEIKLFVRNVFHLHQVFAWSIEARLDQKIIFHFSHSQIYFFLIHHWVSCWKPEEYFKRQNFEVCILPWHSGVTDMSMDEVICWNYFCQFASLPFLPNTAGNKKAAALHHLSLEKGLRGKIWCYNFDTISWRYLPGGTRCRGSRKCRMGEFCSRKKILGEKG